MSPPPELVAALAINRRGPGHAIPRPLKTAVIDFAVARRAAGEKIRMIARALGMPTSTLQAWLSASRKRGLVPVEVVGEPVAVTLPAAPVSRSLRLECPGGYVVQGLDVDQVVAVLRGLS